MATDFAPDIVDVIEEAYRRLGVDAQALIAGHLESARFSLNLILRQWDKARLASWTLKAFIITTDQPAAILPADFVDLVPPVMLDDAALTRIPYWDWVSLPGAAAAVARDSICRAQQVAAAGALTMDGALVSGGVVTLVTPAAVSFYSAGDLSARTFSVAGTDGDGNSQLANIIGPNGGTVATAVSFKTVTLVTVNGSVGSDVEVGISGAAADASPPVSYRINRTTTPPRIDFSPAPTASITVTGWYIRRLSDVDVTTSLADLPTGWVDALIADLAQRLYLKLPVDQRTGSLKADLDTEAARQRQLVLGENAEPGSWFY